MGSMIAAPVRRVGRVFVDSLAAGVVVGLVESVRVVTTLDEGVSFGAAAYMIWVVTALTCLGCALIGPLLVGGAGLAWRVGALAAWRERFGRGGGERAAAVVQLAVLGAGLVAFAGATYAISSWAHGSFKEARAIGLLEAGVLVVVATTILALAATGGRALAPRAARLASIHPWLQGWRGLAIFAVSGAILLGLVAGLASIAAPAADLAAPFTIFGIAIALGIARAVRPSRHRFAPIAAGVVAFASLAALVPLPGSPEARGAISQHGVASRRVLAVVWSAVDRDGDGYPPEWAGGADCDDRNPGVHPAAPEIPGNGIDENCTGLDLTESDLAHRMRPRPSAFVGAPRRNVLLISVDALRADHLGSYGYERPTSPNLDALAARSTRFEWALSPSPTTRRAIPGLMTGRYASALTWRKGGKLRIDATAFQTLGEALKQAGWETAAINCCKTLFGEKQGVLEGIDHIDTTADAIRKDRPERYNGDIVTDRVVKWIEAHKGKTKPFFLWTHLIDPHHPYHRLPGTPDFGRRAIDRYDSEIVFTDLQIGRMLQALRRAGLEQSTIVVVTSDHGEEFGEHGLRFHAGSLYNQVARVPLIVHWPGGPPGVVSTPVSSIDVTPTLLDLLGIAGSPGQNGVSHAATIVRGTAPEARPVLSELIPDYEIKRNLLGVWDGDWKLVWDRDANSYRMYSLRDDPHDTRDRSRADPDRVQRLRAILQSTADVEFAPLKRD